jgi:hypothetical protein
MDKWDNGGIWRNGIMEYEWDYDLGLKKSDWPIGYGIIIYTGWSLHPWPFLL